MLDSSKDSQKLDAMKMIIGVRREWGGGGGGGGQRLLMVWV